MAASEQIRALARQRVRDVAKRYGGGWHMLGREFQEGAICKEFASIVLANAHAETPEAAKHFADTYREMMFCAFGE